MNIPKKLTSERCRSGWRQCRRSLLSRFSVFVFGVLAATAVFAQPTAQDFQRTTVAEGLDLPMEFEISEDGRAFIINKCGAFYGWNIDSGVATVTSNLPDVRCVWEDGALSLALDPNFTQNHYIYFQYTSPGSITRVSRYTVNSNNSLDLGSRRDLLQWGTGNEAHGHMGGSMIFDNQGNLLITTGDNMAAGGYYTDSAQASSGNTNDLRGKVLRIKPTASGGYTIPAGNLFGGGDALHRAEIYGMGFRNPYRINKDPLTGYLYVGDIGPDASTASSEGPMGMDELNEIRQAGNFGWPWIIGYNQPYAGFNPNNLTNNYHLNTGATNIPNATPAMWTILHRATMPGPVYRFDQSINNSQKLPQYYDGRLIFWDFNSSKFFTIDLSSNANPPVAEDFPLNTQGIEGAIDAELDPRTHQLYVLQWGTGCCGKEPYGNGKLYRFDHVGDVNLGPRLTGIATATSQMGGNTAQASQDGNPSTRWESASSDPQSLTVDLQQETTLGAFRILWEAAYSSNYRIEASINGSNWDVLVNNASGGGTTMHTVNSTNLYRYVRFTGTARATGYGHSFYEFEIYPGETVEPPKPGAYLNLPQTLDANFSGVPLLLSQTGAFSNTPNMTPVSRMIPFEPNTKLWSDRAVKQRWISIPDGAQVGWDPEQNWTWPAGTVAVKHFALPINANNPSAVKRLETRFIVMQTNGQVYGVTYKWRADNSDADLLTTDVQENINVTNSDGSVWTQTWTYPSPSQCIDCHNAGSAQFLGLSTRHLNGNYNYPGIGTQNQLIRWKDMNLFTPSFSNAQVAGFDKMADINDTSASLEHRVKSYIDTNCAHCHGTGNGGSQWDGRFNTPLNEMGIVDELTTGIRNYQNYYGISNAMVVDSGNPHESILYIRDKSVDPDDRMPPLGRALEDTTYIQVLEQWITSLTGGTGGEQQWSAATASASTFEGDYAAAKAGMHGFTISLARENAKLGITVNTVSPGYVATDMVMAVPEEVRAKIAADIPTGRLGKPEEIAYAVAFLVDDQAAWITGSNLDINGGHHMGW